MARRSISIQVIGIKEVKKALKTENGRILKKLDDGVLKGALMLTAEVKLSIAGQRTEPTSVDTGRFLNSVSFKKNKPFEASVFSDVDYALFLEYGTSNIPARRHFTNSSIRTQPKIIGLIRQEIRQK